MRLVLLALLLPLLLSPSCAEAALATFRGNESGWDADGRSVVVADVVEVVEREGEWNDGTHVAELRLHSKLAGSLDPGLHTALKVRFWVGLTGTSIHTAPQKGDTILAVVQPTRDDHVIISDVCTFMPDGSSIAVIDGLGDPRIAETLRRIRVARADPGWPERMDKDPVGELILTSSELAAIEAPRDGTYGLYAANGDSIRRENLLRGDPIGFARSNDGEVVGIARGRMNLRQNPELLPYEWRLIRALAPVAATQPTATAPATQSATWATVRQPDILIPADPLPLYEGERGPWTDPNDPESFILADVLGVRPQYVEEAGKKRIDSYRLLLAPHMTFAGRLDPSVHCRVVALQFVAPPQTAFRGPPDVGQAVLAVVSESSPGGFKISQQLYPFMPTRTALTAARGAGDPVVAETLVHFRAMRREYDQQFPPEPDVLLNRPAGIEVEIDAFRRDLVQRDELHEAVTKFWAEQESFEMEALQKLPIPKADGSGTVRLSDVAHIRIRVRPHD